MKIDTTKTAAILSLSFLIAACGGAPTATTAAEAPEATPSKPASTDTFAQQVAQGEALYTKHCAECHGASGEGNPGPAVVGLAKGALPLDPPPKAKARTMQFKTVADVGGFVMKNMPPKNPGSLSQDEYLAILAFDLKANGIDLPAKLDLAKASTLTIPR